MAIYTARSNWKSLASAGLLLLLGACQPAVTTPRPQPSPTASILPVVTSALTLERVNNTKVVLFPLKGWSGGPMLKTSVDQPWQVEKLVGSDSADFADGQGDQASMAYPWGLAVNAQGLVFIADRFNHRIRQLKIKDLSTLAGQRDPGSKDGTGSQSQFNNPQGLCMGPKGEMYVADSGGGTIRKVTSEGQVTTLIKDLQNPAAVVADADGNLIVAEAGAHRVLFWNASTREIHLLAGSSVQGKQDDVASKAGFFSPRGLALAADGTLYIADSLNHLIRKISRTGLVSTLAGNGSPALTDGKGKAASFNEPGALTLEGNDDLLVVDTGNAKVRRVTIAGEVSTLNLPDTIRQPQGIAINQAAIWLSDSRRHSVFRVRQAMP